MDLLTEQLNSDNPTEKIAAILTSAELKRVDLLPLIRAAIQSDNSSIRWAAVCAISKLNDRTAIPLLIERLKDTDYWVRAATIAALTQLETDNLVTLILPMLTDKSPLVIVRTLYALLDNNQPLSSPAIEKIQSLVEDSRQVVEYHGEIIGHIAIYTLTRLGYQTEGEPPSSTDMLSQLSSEADDTLDFDAMSPEQLMGWMETLAKRQGTSEEFMTSADIEVAEVAGDPIPNASEDIPDAGVVTEIDIADMPDWLAESTEDTIDMPDWLTEDESNDDTIPDWLSDAGVGDIEAAAIPDWLKDTVEESIEGIEGKPTTRQSETKEFAIPSSQASPVLSPQKQLAKFSAYFPREAQINQRNTLFVYAYAEDFEITVHQDIQKFRTELLGNLKPRTAKQAFNLAIGTRVTIVPECDTIEFEPESLTKSWHGDWTRFDFDFRPSEATSDETQFVRVSVQVADIEVAHIKCAIDVINNKPSAITHIASAMIDNVPDNYETVSVTPYQRIFISYSRRDSEVVVRYKQAQIALGNDAFLDVDNLRSGVDWKAELGREIKQADIFQLFWSNESAKSEHCRFEWMYALQERCQNIRCEGFIRPVYWQKPMPPPPPELSHLNFRFVPFA